MDGEIGGKRGSLSLGHGIRGRIYLFGASVVVEVLVKDEVGVDVRTIVGFHSVQDVDVEEVCWMGCCAVHSGARCRMVNTTRR